MKKVEWVFVSARARACVCEGVSEKCVRGPELRTAAQYRRKPGSFRNGTVHPVLVQKVDSEQVFFIFEPDMTP